MSEQQSELATVRLEFTDKGRYFARLWSTEEDVLARIRVSIMEDLAPNVKTVDGFIFHTVSLKEHGEQDFILTPGEIRATSEPCIIIDAVLYEEIMLTEGPFAGKTVMIPSAATPDYDDEL